MDIKCVVVCIGQDGNPAFYKTTIEDLTKKEYEEGTHYNEAQAEALEKGFEEPMVIIDEYQFTDNMILALLWLIKEERI